METVSDLQRQLGYAFTETSYTSTFEQLSIYPTLFLGEAIVEDYRIVACFDETFFDHGMRHGQELFFIVAAAKGIEGC